MTPNSLDPYPFSPYQIGGSLPAQAPTYVERKADQQFFQALLARDYCAVLDARQMGKSSLRIRTMTKLQEQGVVCGVLELLGIGSQEITPTQWYGGMIQMLISNFGLQVNRRAWIQAHADLSPVQRLREFIDQVLLVQIAQPVVIFIDEVDCVLNLNFNVDEFFALIRHCYDKRATVSAYGRLTFALLGVAAPSDLIQNLTNTPFNIGRSIILSGFQASECGVLEQGFVGLAENPQAVVKAVLHWSGGQPFLTQKLCWLIIQRGECIKAGAEVQSLRHLVQTRILDHWQAQDQPEHLKTIRDRLLHPRHHPRPLINNLLINNPLIKGNDSFSSPKRTALLTLCQRLLRRGKLLLRRNPLYLELQLSGLVEQHQNYLRVKNPIYEMVFDCLWVDQELQRLQPTRFPLPAWTTPAIGTLATLGVVTLRSLGLLQTWELNGFDHLMRLRPDEGADPRLLLITITEADVQFQPLEQRGAASLSNRALEQLLAKLLRGNPQAIGFDIYRETPLLPSQGEMAHTLAQDERIFAICHYGTPGVSAPPEIPAPRQGFNNVLLDPDGILRRHLLGVVKPAPCGSNYAFSWQLAAHYLASQGLTPTITPEHKRLKLGENLFPRLYLDRKGFPQVNSEGYQTWLNYRATEEIAKKVSLQDFLDSSFDVQQLEGRIILIGTVAPSFNDHNWLTPYSHGQSTLQTLSGVEIQAHMVSQILSAVLDDRPLLRPWGWGMDMLWVGFWAGLGSGVMVWQRSAWRRVGAMGPWRSYSMAVVVSCFGVGFGCR
jgi:CHASE2 domain-containing sensor protein